MLPDMEANAVLDQAWNAAHYDRAGAFVPKLAADLVSLLAPRAGERVLDLGCGSGDLTRAIAESGAEAWGVDASADMVAQARAKHPNVPFVVMDGQALTYEAELDAVFSNAALHWMPRAEDVARGVARALRSGGRFVAEFGGARNVQTVREALSTALTEHGLHAHGAPAWYFPSVAEYARVLDGAGLFVHSAHWFERPTRLQEEGERGLETWLELFCLPLLTALGDRRAAVVAETERRCRPRLFRDGSWWLDYARLRVVASKP